MRFQISDGCKRAGKLAARLGGRVLESKDQHMANKPTLAFFSLACCEGCQLQVLACEEKLLPILEKADIVRFREASDGDADHYDVAFVEARS